MDAFITPPPCCVFVSWSRRLDSVPSIHHRYGSPPRRDSLRCSEARFCRWNAIVYDTLRLPRSNAYRLSCSLNSLRFHESYDHETPHDPQPASTIPIRCYSTLYNYPLAYHSSPSTSATVHAFATFTRLDILGCGWANDRIFGTRSRGSCVSLLPIC